jgi:hypothetical protein
MREKESNVDVGKTASYVGTASLYTIPALTSNKSLDRLLITPCTALL